MKVRAHFPPMFQTCISRLIHFLISFMEACTQLSLAEPGELAWTPLTPGIRGLGDLLESIMSWLRCPRNKATSSLWSGSPRLGFCLFLCMCVWEKGLMASAVWMAPFEALCSVNIFHVLAIVRTSHHSQDGCPRAFKSLIFNIGHVGLLRWTLAPWCWFDWQIQFDFDVLIRFNLHPFLLHLLMRPCDWSLGHGAHDKHWHFVTEQPKVPFQL